MTWPDYPVGDPEVGGRLRAAGLCVRLAPKRGARTPAELRALARGAAAAIVSTDPFDASVLEAAPRLKVIARVGVGVDSIDLAAATAAGVAVTTTPGANEATVADHTLALILAAVRRVPEHDAGVRRGEWNRTGPHAPWELTGRTVGLVGFGAIGRLVATRLQGFGVRILVADPARPARRGSELVPLTELLRRADVVSLHAPLLPSTRLLIGAAELALMRRQAILVNTSRGGLVDQDALLVALETGMLRAAALDVFDREPPSSARLRELPNVVLTPHVGGISEQSVRQMTGLATMAVLAVLRGERPPGLVNPEALPAPVRS